MDHLDFVISRVWRNDNKQIEIASAGTILNEDDKIFVITTDQDAESVKTFIGEEIDMERKQWIRMESQFINRRTYRNKPAEPHLIRGYSSPPPIKYPPS